MTFLLNLFLVRTCIRVEWHLILLPYFDTEGNDSWEKIGSKVNRGNRSEDNTAKETPSSHSREHKSANGRHRNTHSLSDSEDSFKFRQKQASRRGQKDRDGVGVIASSPDDLHPKVSSAEPDIRYEI